MTSVGFLLQFSRNTKLLKRHEFESANWAKNLKQRVGEIILLKQVNFFSALFL